MNVSVCQIRMSQEKTIRDLATELASSILESLEREVDYSDQGSGRALAFESPVLDALFPYVKAYNACGKHVVCTAAVQSIACPDFDDQIYILQLPFGVEGLVQEIVAKSLNSLVPLLDTHLLDDVRQRAESAAWRILKPHLYTNPQCRNHDVCILSEPMDPWPAALRPVWR